jgi:Flagellar assembly protein T, middle domain/Flagellar assembly protein T, N-terminal domain
MCNRIVWLTALAASLVSCKLYAAAIEAEGIAAIGNGGVEHARRVARDDAVRQASLQLGTTVVSSEQLISNGTTLRSGTVRPAAQVNNFAVLREWNDAGTLHVIIRADDRVHSAEHKSLGPYRKKVLLTPFHISNPFHAQDIDDVSRGIPRDLAQRLEQTGKFQSRVSRFAVPLESAGGTPEEISLAVKRLAAEYDSQFVVSGEVVDTGTSSDKGLFTTSTTRRFEVRALVYDGLTGVLIAQHRLNRVAEGSVSIGVDKPFGSNAFFSTGFGRAIDAVLASLAVGASDNLEPLPFTAQIVKIANGKIIFNAGTTSSVVPGDKLVAYRRKLEWDVASPINGADGIVETPAATVTVIQVQPSFAIGELAAESEGAKLKVGDYVRFSSSQ